MAQYFVNIVNAAVFVKEGEFFQEQVATTKRFHPTDTWYEGWIEVDATSIEHARVIGVGIKREREVARG